MLGISIIRIIRKMKQENKPEEYDKDKRNSDIKDNGGL
jgi:hypothetical protein